MTCPNCGCDIEKGMNKCTNCGMIVFERKKNNASKTSSSSARKKHVSEDKEPSTFQNTDINTHLSDTTITKGDALPAEIKASDLTDENENQHDENCSIPQATSNIPADMDLGRSTKYYCSLRKTPTHMTRWQKLVFKFTPAKDAPLDKFEDAAIRNLVVAHIIIFLSLLFTFLANYLFYFYDQKRINWMFTIAAMLLLIWSRLFLDNAVKNYSYNVYTESRKCKVSKSITAVLIVSNLIMTIFFLLFSYVYFLSDLYYAILFITGGR